jgi:2-keto-4-pentenoate hydratase/2-oxohepta-3-ene-1,7-dioic acid hydratase in catechol pathway
MHLVTFRDSTGLQVGVHEPGGIVPIAACVPNAPADMVGVVAAGATFLAQLRDGLAKSSGKALAPDTVTVVAPIPVPRRNIVCVGKNYYDHANEFETSGFDSSSAGQVIPEVPIIFTKATTSVIGPGDEINSSLDPDDTLDYEGELTIVIGKSGRGIAADRAFEHIYGYTIINDVTARGTQQRHKQWFLGKSSDTFCPMGPAILTADAVPDITALRLETRVNKEVRQSVGVKDLIFDIPTIIETVSRSMTLQPGDLIATGTPAGVAIGFKPPRYLKPGDVVSVTVQPIGTLTNRIA